MAEKDDDIDRGTREAIIKEFQEHDKDTGSAGVQVGFLSFRIEETKKILKKDPRDKHKRSKLLEMVGKRRTLLFYLQSTSMERYEVVCEKLERLIPALTE